MNNSSLTRREQVYWVPPAEQLLKQRDILDNADAEPNHISDASDTQNMTDQSATTEADKDSGQNNGWTGTNIGGLLPEESGNTVRSYVLKRRFKNLVKTTDMNSINGYFTKYQGSETGIHNAGQNQSREIT